MNLMSGLPALLAQASEPATTTTGITINVNAIVNTLIYTGVGVVVFAMAFFVMSKVIPFSVRKEIEEDQNTALGVIMGSIVIGLALIISAAVHG